MKQPKAMGMEAHEEEAQREKHAIAQSNEQLTAEIAAEIEGHVVEKLPRKGAVAVGNKRNPYLGITVVVEQQEEEVEQADAGGDEADHETGCRHQRFQRRGRAVFNTARKSSDSTNDMRLVLRAPSLKILRTTYDTDSLSASDSK